MSIFSIGYSKARDGWMNRRYWRRLWLERNIIADRAPEHIWDVLNKITSLTKLTAFMSKITYTPDHLHPWVAKLIGLRFATFHWWQDPVTTIHRMKGDCDDMAKLWWTCLQKMDYEAHIYLCYRKFWWTFGASLPWHFVCVWREQIKIPLSNIVQGRWFVASNTEISMIPPAKTAEKAIEGYVRWDGYSRARKLTERQVTG
jgi:hypothetical protein